MSSLSLFHEPPTALDSINVAKVLTGVAILYWGGKYGYTPRSTMYTGIHISYLCWWFLEQALFPPFADRFSDPVDTAGWVGSLLILGLLYAFPAFNAFRNTNKHPHTAVSVVSIVMFTLGCLINAMADVQMHATKMTVLVMTGEKGRYLVTQGIYRLCQNPNWLGDYMRYGSFCLLSGEASSFIVLALVMLINFGSLQDPTAKGGMLERYGKAYEIWIQQVPNKVLPNLDSNTLIIMGGVALIWTASFAFGKVLSDKQSHLTTSTNKSKTA